MVSGKRVIPVKIRLRKTVVSFILRADAYECKEDVDGKWHPITHLLGPRNVKKQIYELPI